MTKVRKAVITAAGRGTRQYPASAAVQKELFPLVDRDGLTKPVIQVIAEEALDSGIEEICIVTPPGRGDVYREYFRHPPDDLARSLRGRDWAMLAAEKLAELGKRLTFVEQDRPEGFGHAVYQARAFAAGEPFLLLLGDHVYVSDTVDRCARQVLDVFEGHEASAVTAVQLMGEGELHLFGTILGRPIDERGKVFEAELIIEKPTLDEARRRLATPGIPAGNYLGHFGIHVFSAEIFEMLEKLIAEGRREKGEIQMTSAQELLRQEQENYLIARVAGKRYDTGIPFGLMEAQLALGLYGVHRVEMLESITRVLAGQKGV